LTVESLEDRLVPTFLWVFPEQMPENATTFHTLAQAVAVAQPGDTIEVIPFTTPGDATVTVDNLTIQGPPVDGAGTLRARPGTSVGSITILGHNDTLQDLYFNNVQTTLGNGATSTTIRNCIFQDASVVQAFGPAVNGNTTVTNNTFLGTSCVRLGNTWGDPAHTAFYDHVTNNNFPDTTLNPNLLPIAAYNETGGLVISGNILDHDAAQPGNQMIVATDCVGTIADNTIHHAFLGIAVNDADVNHSTDPLTTNITVYHNLIADVVNAVSISRTSTASTFVVSLADNTLAATMVDLDLWGNRAGGDYDFGEISAGGDNGLAASTDNNVHPPGWQGAQYRPASAASSGNNDFRAGPSTFLIVAHDGPNTSRVTAEHNRFNVSEPAAKVFTDSAPGLTLDLSDPITGDGSPPPPVPPRLPTTLYVVDVFPNGLTSFGSLADAVAAAVPGDTIKLEPGVFGSASIWVDDLTIQPDRPYGGDVGILFLHAKNTTLSHLFLQGVVLAPGATGTTISDCTLGGKISQTATAPGVVNGNTTITNNDFLPGTWIELANSANDQITNNSFYDATTAVIAVGNETAGLVVANNRVWANTEVFTAGGAFFEFADCVGRIENNTINATAGRNNVGMLIDGLAAATNLTVNGNQIQVSGIGIDFGHDLSSVPFNVSLAHNSLVGDALGFYFLGNDFNHVSGGGTNNGVFSAGGNDFSGIPLNAAGERAAIVTRGIGSGPGNRVTALYNTFSSTRPCTTPLARPTRRPWCSCWGARRSIWASPPGAVVATRPA
jgi:hypothetical protein